MDGRAFDRLQAKGVTGLSSLSAFSPAGKRILAQRKTRAVRRGFVAWALVAPPRYSNIAAGALRCRSMVKIGLTAGCRRAVQRSRNRRTWPTHSSRNCSILSVQHDLFRKPVPTFRDHAL